MKNILLFISLTLFSCISYADIYTDYPEIIYYYDLIDNDTVSFDRVLEFSGTGLQEDFVLNEGNKAYKFIRISEDNGGTWIYPTDSKITWGSNIDYTNAQIEYLDGYIGNFKTRIITISTIN